MRDVTIVFPYFMNRGMVTEHQRIWADYPVSMRSHLHVVIVDDCSPNEQRLSAKAITADGLGSVRLFRLLNKVPWNWLACRNLGADVAQTEWLLLTDIDHGVPTETLRWMMESELDVKTVYRFKRLVAPKPYPYELSTCAEWKPHNDSWLLTKKLFFHKNVGGYDERLSGCYGTSGEFKDRLFAVASSHVLTTQVLIRYPREIIPDASTHPSLYRRKNNPDNDQELERRKIARSLIRHWKPLRGLTPWEEIPLMAVA